MTNIGPTKEKGNVILADKSVEGERNEKIFKKLRVEVRREEKLLNNSQKNEQKKNGYEKPRHARQRQNRRDVTISTVEKVYKEGKFLWLKNS